MTDQKPFVACGFCGVKISPVIGCNTTFQTYCVHQFPPFLGKIISERKINVKCCVMKAEGNLLYFF